MKRFLVSILLVLSACSWAAAESSVWKAQKGSFVLYLGGTCHVLRESDYPLPPEFEKAYKASDVVVLETDLGKLNDPDSQQKLLSKVLYLDGTTVEDHLSPRVYRELSAFCEANGIPLSKLKQFKPSMLMVTVTVMELMKLGVSQQGVDHFFYQLAKKEKKPIAALETVDEQMNYLATMADGNEDDFVMHALQDMKSLQQMYDDVATAWRKGDAGKLDEIMISELKAKDAKLYRKLITERNGKWLSAIDTFRKSPQTRLMLVGVAHLVGSDGIIESLKKKGYKVEKL